MSRSRTDPTRIRRTPEKRPRQETIDGEEPSTTPRPRSMPERVTITIPRYMKRVG